MSKENKEVLKRELQELDSSLGPPGRDAGFTVPEGYFGDLPDKIRDRTYGKTRQGVFRDPVVPPKQMLAWAASLLLLVGFGISLFLMRSDRLNDQIAFEEHAFDFEYFSMQPDFDQDAVYQMVLESDLSAEEIRYGPDLYLDDADYDEMMEMILEEAGYYGIETNYLLSSLD